MARRAKQKLLTQLPAQFDPDFIERLNRNYRLGWIVHDRRQALQAHCGGDPSYVQQGTIKRIIWLELLVENLEQKFANGEEIDVGALTQSINTLKGLYKDIGVLRKGRLISLRDRVASQQEAASAA